MRFTVSFTFIILLENFCSNLGGHNYKAESQTLPIILSNPSYTTNNRCFPITTDSYLMHNPLIMPSGVEVDWSKFVITILPFCRDSQGKYNSFSVSLFYLR